MVARRQLLLLDFSVTRAMRSAPGRERDGCTVVHRGVYAVGRPELTLEGRFMAAVLACGPTAALSHGSAAQLWGFRPVRAGAIEVSTTKGPHRRRPGIVLHRRTALGERDVTKHRGIPVTTPVCTLIDLAVRLPRAQLEAAVNEADKLGLAGPDALVAAVDEANRPGAAKLRSVIVTHTLTRSALERRFLPIARKAGLPRPRTNERVNGHEVDFHWPELGLVVETDGLTYHRTPNQQAKDRLRDQAHTAAGLTQLRFTHEQVRSRPAEVART